MPVSPYIENDLTKNIRIHYKTLRFKKNILSYPSSIEYQPQNFLDEIKRGLLKAYKQIHKNKENLLSLYSKYKAKLQLRQIQRHTIYYYWLIYKTYHPCNKNKTTFINKNLSIYSNKITNYEKNMIKTGNIPVFFHKPHKQHIYSKDKLLDTYFYNNTAEYWFFKKLESIDTLEFIKKRISELENLLSI